MPAVCVSALVIVWTVGFIHKKNGANIFLVIFILLFFVGGGIAQVAFFLIAWGTATQINSPLTFWKKNLSENNRKLLDKLWLPFCALGYLFLGIGIAIWLLFTPPGSTYQGLETAYWTCWITLLIGVTFQILTILSGFAGDINWQDRTGRLSNRGEYVSGDQNHK